MKDLQKMYNELMTVNSKLKKLEIIKKYPENKEILFYIYHPQYIFGVTSANLKKNKDLPNPFPVTYKSIIYLLDSLRLRKITGHAAINAVNDFIKANPKHEDLIYKIIDRNLKASIGITEINKVWPGLIPEFKVQLADLYINAKVAENSKKLKKVLKASKIDYSERWYASRKLDGLRCVTIFDEEGVPVCWSRQGKEFFTLDVLKKSFEDIPVNLRKNMVFDGELCILKENGDEDFKAIGKLYGKTDKIDGVKV